MKWLPATLLWLFFFQASHAQLTKRPKLVVGIIVDQMRWDYLERFQSRFDSNGGFKRLLSKGFNCTNTYINYTPSLTACGHAAMYTGSVPAVHGITGNDWWDNKTQSYVYCTQDNNVATVGNSGDRGKMSPANLLGTTIADELRLATGKASKVFGIALKDRGGILAAGHAANAAYWYDDKTGEWISSTYYMQQLPEWVLAFNKQKLVDSFYTAGWSTLYPLATYTQSTGDDKPYEIKPFGTRNGFPYDLKKFAGTNYNPFFATPFGNTFTTEFAKSLIRNEQLGADSIPDFLAISYSSTDYVGHSFGTNAIEIEDTYLRLDKDLGTFFNYLDATVGKDQWLLVLSSDHGAAQPPGFLKENKIPAGHFDNADISDKLNQDLFQKFKVKDLVIGIINYQVVFNLPLIESSSKLKWTDIKKSTINFLSKQTGVERAFALEDINATTLTAKLKSMVANGYYPNRTGQIQFVLNPQYLDGFAKGGTTHGLWNPYDTHIPLLWYGWGIRPGTLNREIYITDIAPTLATLLRIQTPSGAIGKPIDELVK